MTSDTEMGDDTSASISGVFTKRRFGNLWPGPSRSGGVTTGLSRSSAPSASSSPVSSGSNGTNTSRRSSLANLINEVDISDTNGNGVEHLPEVTEDDDDDEEDTEGEVEGEGEGEGEGMEGAEEEDDENDEDEEGDEDEDEDDEDDDEDDSEGEEDPERGRSTASKPSSFAHQATPTAEVRASISINGDASNANHIPVTTEPTAAVGPSQTATPGASSSEGPSIIQNALADAITAAGLANDTSTPSTASTVKPKSKAAKPRKQRTPSPSPPPPVAPPPVRTIRLEIVLGGPSNYEVDISRRAKDTGQKEATPPPPPGLAPTEDEQKAVLMEQQEELEGAPKKKKRRKGPAQEYYDTSDPFIDDSELAVDQRIYFAQTKQQGFYVSSGEVALMKDKNPKKPKSKKLPLGGPISAVGSGSTMGGGDGTRDSPIPLVDEDANEGAFVNVISKGIKGVGIVSSSGVIGGHIAKEGAPTKAELEEEGDEKTGQKRKRYITVVEGGKKRKVVNINSFHPDLQAAIEKLKESISKENWEQKGKFPPALKPQLAQLALLAIKLDEYDDHFFNLMPVLFPYNKFTMTKLIKRTVFADHIALLQERQDLLVKQLEEQAKAGFTRAEEEWKKSVQHWHRRQEKLAAEGGAGAGESISAGPTRAPSEDRDAHNMMDATETPSAVGGDGSKISTAHGVHPPGKKYRLTEQMKGLIWDLVLLSNEACRLENEKNGYEGSVIQISEQGGRKVLYQKIVAAFPEGWMSSGQISRDVSAMKKRLEREAMDD